MTSDARLRISLASGEFEVEGSEAFIAQYKDTVRQMLEKLPESMLQSFVSADNSIQTGANVASDDQGTRAEAELPEFGEAIHRLPRGASGTDQILIAGFYVSKRSANSTFSTADANKLLIDQGIKISNPSQSLKNNLAAKRVFKDGKAYKLSREGIEKVSSLLGLPR
ncbi:hypothetical protein [Actinomadura decatromicini]|uniref:Uncharacterized protein n=1 Tax=Actinomadura decatromicini TaxID=2604572 RepID=A0A5D3FXH0_9ACTN|nr:hypothetical protein [Actinomadura decatromicini]TYK52390.1 hypothetical protein FXF68_00940 [Actinomadura decatromicini]